MHGGNSYGNPQANCRRTLRQLRLHLQNATTEAHKRAENPYLPGVPGGKDHRAEAQKTALVVGASLT